MDERQFDILVTDVTKEEYIQASSQMIYGLLPTGLLLVTLVTGCILLLMDTITIAAIVSPYVLLLVVLLLGLFYVRADWKRFPKDVNFSYLIDAEGWQLTIGDSYGGADWIATGKLKECSKVLLFYQRGSSASSMLPKRCLTEEQLEAIRGWYRDSRPSFREHDKEWTREEREARRASRSKKFR